MKWLVVGLSFLGIGLVSSTYAGVTLGAALDYARRGDDQFRFAHYELAIENYSQAIKIEPNAPRFYYARARAEEMLGQDQAALADLDATIHLSPRFSGAYNSRAAIKQRTGDLDGSLADFTLAIALYPRSYKLYCNRGVTKYQKGDLSGAFDDFRQASQLEPTDAYPEIFLWLVQIRQGQGAEADKQLSAFLDKHIERSTDHWGSKICSFLTGRLSETEFVGGTGSYFAYREQGHQCEAWYYVGTKRLLAGDKTGAVDAFEKSIATKSRNFQEYLLARFELKRMGKA